MNDDASKERAAEPADAKQLARLHRAAGWWALFVFAGLGFGLETLHAFKVGAYLGVDQETRRLLFRLAHAHGALLGLVQLAFASQLSVWPLAPGARGLASGSLLAALLLLPGGFFLGGLGAVEGDPGGGVALVPLGAGLFLVGLGITAWVSLRRA